MMDMQEDLKLLSTNNTKETSFSPSSSTSTSMRKSPHNRRNTVSLPLWCDNTNYHRQQSVKEEEIKQEEKSVKDEEKEIRRQSMNDLASLKNNFCHLSREELIQRVVQLEKEKQLQQSLGKKFARSLLTRKS